MACIIALYSNRGESECPPIVNDYKVVTKKKKEVESCILRRTKNLRSART